MHDIQDRNDIDLLVKSFYGRVFSDPEIGFIFTDIAHVTAEEHFPLMGDFWETILFARNRYHGNAILKHVLLQEKVELKPLHFERWLSLFTQTVDSLFAGEKAEIAKIRARTIATVLQAKLQLVHRH